MVFHCFDCFYFMYIHTHKHTSIALCCSAFICAFMAWDFSITNTPANPRAHALTSPTHKTLLKFWKTESRSVVWPQTAETGAYCSQYSAILFNSTFSLLFFHSLSLFLFSEPPKMAVLFVRFGCSVLWDGGCPRFHTYAFAYTFLYVSPHSYKFISIKC